MSGNIDPNEFANSAQQYAENNPEKVMQAAGEGFMQGGPAGAVLNAGAEVTMGALEEQDKKEKSNNSQPKGDISSSLNVGSSDGAEVGQNFLSAVTSAYESFQKSVKSAFPLIDAPKPGGGGAKDDEKDEQQSAVGLGMKL